MEIRLRWLRRDSARHQIQLSRQLLPFTLTGIAEYLFTDATA
jgi:hypothetical protein